MASSPPRDPSRRAQPGRSGASGDGSQVHRISTNPSGPRPGDGPPSPRPRARSPQGGGRPPRSSGTDGTRGARPRPAEAAPYVERDPLGESSWAAFFRPVRSSKEGTMPAGMVLLVTVASLVVALFLSGSAIQQKAAGRRPNNDSRRTIAEAVGTFSSALKLDWAETTLNDAVAESIGHQKRTSNVSDEDLRDDVCVANGSCTPDATVAADPSAPVGSTPPTTIDRTPKVRTPTPDAPLKLWVGGDSISYEPGIGLQNIVTKTKLMTMDKPDARASTGLTRPDYFNWPDHLLRDVTPLNGGGIDPDVMVIMFGGNDDQNIPAWNGNPAYVAGTPEWQAEYRQRVGNTMDLLKSKDNDRLILWVGAPVMSPGRLTNIDEMDYIYATEAARRPWVKYLDSWPFFSDDAGNFAQSLPSADGSMHNQRSNDGVHMSLVGGNRLGIVIYQKLASLIDLSASPFAPDPAMAPPPTITERPEVPLGDGSVPAPG